MSDSQLQFVEAQGTRFACLVEGTGPLVLLLHGFPDTARSWDALRPTLARRGFRAVSPFLRGYHPSAIPSRDTDQETLARDVVGLIDALGGPAIVVGHDWGASAAYGAAGLAPERITQLITIAIPHPATLRPTPRKVWGVRHFLAYKMPGAAARFARNDFEGLTQIVRRWSPTWAPSPEELGPVRETFAHAESLDAAFGYYRALSFSPTHSLRARIRVPTVAFCGTDDPMTDRSDFERARRMFEGDYAIEEMPGGHFMHREHPDVFEARLFARLNTAGVVREADPKQLRRPG